MEENERCNSSRAERVLAPVRTGRQTPDDAVSLLPDTREKEKQLEMKKKEPLPPITGGNGGEDLEDEQQIPLQPNTSSVIGTTMAASNPQSRNRKYSGSRKPAIVSYRRETRFPEQKKKLQSTIANRIVEKRKGVDGEDIVLVSENCQTDWSYLDEMKNRKQVQRSVSSSPLERQTPRSSGSSSPESSNDSQPESVDEDLKLDDVDSRTPEGDEENGYISLIDGAIDVKKKPLSAGLHWSESEVTFMESEPPLPQPSREDEYGIPVLPLSDSDDSDDDSDYIYQYKGGDEKGTDQPDAGTLPSIGPPQILQYQRESEAQDLATLNPEDRVKEYEELYLDYGEDGIVAKGYDMVGGPCEFCNDTIKPFPTLEDQEKRSPAELYCCSDYKEFVHFMVSQQIKPSDDDLIDISPHAAFGSKQARKAAKERAAQRMRDRELARQQAAIQAGSGAGGGGGGASQGPANFYQFSKQMKTINYQLSSHKYLEEGWTLRPPSPFVGSRPAGEVFEPEPALPPWASAEEKASRQRSLVLKYYEDGSKYLILFPDGTGNVFYPSGRVAVSISSVEQGLYTVTAHNDDDEPSLVAVFNPNGYGASYFTNGQIRICLEQIGGVELDVSGGRKRKWLWKDQVQHVHAPPIQPITFAITPHLALRIMNQDNMSLTFSCDARSCRFAVGSRLKVVAPENLPPPTVDEDELYREKARTKIATVLSKLSNVLKFPKSPKLDKIPTPLYLSARLEKLQNAKSAKVKHKKDPVIVN